MLSLTLTAFLLLLCYVTVISARYGVPESLSNSYNLLEETRPNLGWLFTALCFIEAIAVAFAMFEYSEGKWFQFTAFFAIGGLALVGAAPKYKEHERTAHFTGAIMSGVASSAWVILMGYWVILRFALGVYAVYFAVGWLRNKGKDTPLRATFWGEMALFASQFAALIIEGIKRI
jgi:hypothetical protein